MGSGFVNVLKNKDFLKIWLAQIFSQSANHLLNFLLVLRIYELTNSNTMVSFLVLSFTIPSIIFGIYAGVCADRFSQKRTMYLANILRALIVLGYAYLGGSIWYIYLAAFLISSAMQFFLPAEAARIPAIVKRENYLAANSLYIFTTYGALLFGYSLAGVVQFLGNKGQFLFITFFFLIAAFSLSFLPYDSGRAKKISLSAIFLGIKKDFIESWEIIKRKADIYMPIFYLVSIWIAIAVSYVLIPSLARDVLHIQTTEVSHLVIIPAGIGAVSGALLVESWGKRFDKKKLIAVGIFFIGITGIFLSTIPNFRHFLIEKMPEFTSSYALLFKIPIINILLFLLGFGAVFIIVSSQTLLQENTEVKLRGRVFGFLSMLINISSFLPILLVGIIADLISMQIVMILMSVAALFMGVLNLFFIYKRK